ncbi:gluconokinase [Demequina sp. NBRC 110051]|uniref:gluconokinase n=1 Tax=Demequina sp. NBRC 110051 TaxID=1570340 RepID=UPI000A01D037
MAARQIVVMGVSACGKSTVGALLAEHLAVAFQDGDDLHPEASKTKMSAGIPLTDDDRWPWLARVGESLAASDSLVIACSALKRSYRDAIRAAAPDAFFVHLAGSSEVLAERAASREGHFMPASLLDSQLTTLEPLDADERGVVLDIAQPVAILVADAVEAVHDKEVRSGRAVAAHVATIDRGEPHE